MESTGASTPAPEPQPEEAGPEQHPGGASARPPLRRSRSDRMLFGVCGGFARHLGVDPVLVRIAALLTLAFGGAGVLAYAAGVLLIPDEGQDEPLVHRRGRRWAAVAGAVLLVIAVAGGLRTLFGRGSPWLPVPLLALGAAILLIAARQREGPHAGAGEPAQPVGAIAFGVALVLGGIFGVLVAAGAVHLGAGAVLGALAIITGLVVAVSSIWGRAGALIAAGVVLLAAGSAVAATDLDLSGGIGRRVYTVTATGASRYRLGVGDLEVDVSRTLPRGTAAVDAKLGVGRLVVDVPNGVPVTVDGTAAVGAGHGRGGVDITRNVVVSEPGRRISVHAHVGVGTIVVR